MSYEPKPNEVVTGEGRFSFCNVFKPREMNNDDEPKYSLTFLLPKDDTETLERMKTAIEATKTEGITSKWNGKLPPLVKTPIHDGDGTRPNGEPFGEECKGHWVFTASSKQKPEVVDVNGHEIANETDVYSGCYGRMYIRMFPYDFSGNRGIGFSLGPVQKLKDGEPLGGVAPSAESVFGAPKPADFGMSQGAVNPITGEPI